MKKPKKVYCSLCGHYGYKKDWLRARNPFDNEILIFGCPKCKEINSDVACCDEPGCEREATCGTPTDDGYRFTCGEHIPKKKIVGTTLEGIRKDD